MHLVSWHKAWNCAAGCLLRAEIVESKQDRGRSKAAAILQVQSIFSLSLSYMHARMAAHDTLIPLVLQIYTLLAVRCPPRSCLDSAILAMTSSAILAMTMSCLLCRERHVEHSLPCDWPLLQRLVNQLLNHLRPLNFPS